MYEHHVIAGKVPQRTKVFFNNWNNIKANEQNSTLQ